MSDDPVKKLFPSQPIQKNTVVAQVMDRVKELISSGAYRPGDRLPTEQELADMFQVGRSSIREALKVFHHLGVVESKAAKGTFIRERANVSLEAITWALVLGDDDLRDVYELREAIEFISFRHFAEKLHENREEVKELVSELREIISRMYAAAEANEKQEMAHADFEFHERIIRGGENKLFLDMYHTLQAFMTNEIIITYEKIEDLLLVAEDHEQIIDILESKTIEEAISRHWEHFLRTRSLLGIKTVPKTDTNPKSS